jgi:hypothetical protein
VNTLILNVAEAVIAAWHAIVTALAWLWRIVDTVLNPVMSWLLRLLNPLCTAVGDVVYAALSLLPAWAGLTIVSIALGVVMLIAFRYTSNQAGIGRAKDDIKAHLLAMKLYRDELRVVLSSQPRILWAILRLQRYVLTPVLILALPMLLVMAQMGIRYQWRPLNVGERTNLIVELRDAKASGADVTMEPHEGIVVEAGPVPGGGKVALRIRGEVPGRHAIHLRCGSATVDKEVVVGNAFSRVSAMRPDATWTDQLLHPAETPLSAQTPVKRIIVEYPQVKSYICGANWWVAYFFVVSMAAALVLKPFFGVRF